MSDNGYVFDKFDIPKMPSVEVLVSLRTKYEEIVEAAKESVAATDTDISSLLKEAKADETLVERVQELKSQFLELTFEVTDENELTTLLIFEMFKELAAYFKYERDLFVNSKKGNKSSEKDEETYNENRKDAESLAGALETMFEMLMLLDKSSIIGKNGKPKDIEGFPMEVSKPRKVKGGKMSEGGKVKYSISNLPRKLGENVSSGRPVTGSHLVLKYNGEQVFPSETCKSPFDVAKHYLSDRSKGIAVTWSSVLETLKKLDPPVNIMTDSWSLPISDGILEGEPVKNG